MLGDRLKKLRATKNLSQQELAKKLNISRGTYAHYEINKRQPDYGTLKKISNFFNVSIDYLITGNEHSNSPDEMWKEFLDPKTQIFFKDLQNAPEEKIEELIRFWEFIKERDKKK
ncbi:transcriptional regulator [Virgibacillus pantothenticus]|uniref:DNA-binding protein n=1 Tax=Virgibacillus pantothenticus TaxID=1473 RepID=A0A0L0QL04_VIRPA|nr:MULTISPECIES: helix-turn-helix transcriptional regulator [Virgibacillus]API91556.1 transcriptional regulator [Virgibacillus sp. 6R]KNE19272.1 DNA-binding protein [Virgibacillus pantothenticus]MBS7426925.1 helix-turn-helix transcriptional regulator [Virgibacillus sp. 19R1-5]MED3735675.1 helix-turn-helix transcriptional regulator [Virgibacillus pantothenticus]QTY15749.1 helix-turn-helix transcriptional regulator [Virgibacillus pantothenticus]